MDAVIKIGGSLQADPKDLRKLCMTLATVSKEYNILVVPGGGRLARVIRKLQKDLKFSDETAHSVALLAMNVYGIVLHELIEGSRLTESLESLSSGCTIFLPFRELDRCEDLKRCWDVTSDSISAWVSLRVGCKKLILVKMTDGIRVGGRRRNLLTTGDLKRVNQPVVDKEISWLLEKGGITCWIVNGKHPNRIKGVLTSKKTVCTQIRPAKEISL